MYQYEHKTKVETKIGDKNSRESLGCKEQQFCHNTVSSPYKALSQFCLGGVVQRRQIIKGNDSKQQFEDFVMTKIDYKAIATKLYIFHHGVENELSFRQQLNIACDKKIDEMMNNSAFSGYEVDNERLMQREKRLHKQEMLEKLTEVFNTLDDSVYPKQMENIIIKYSSPQLRDYCLNDAHIRTKIQNFHPESGTLHRVESHEMAFHQHVEGNRGIEYKMIGNTVTILSVGLKSQATVKGSGGYIWETKPR